MAEDSASLPDASEVEASGTALLGVVSRFISDGAVSQARQQHLTALHAAAQGKRQRVWESVRGGLVPDLALLREVQDAGLEVERLETVLSVMLHLTLRQQPACTANARAGTSSAPFAGETRRDQEECRTESCLFNPMPDTIFCDDKISALCVVKALKIASLLRDVYPASRIAALDAPAVHAAFAAAGLDAGLHHLVDAPGFPSYADALMVCELRNRYGGKCGTLRAFDLNSVDVGDYVTLESNPERLRSWCERYPRGGAKGFDQIMVQLAGATVLVTHRDDLRLIAVALPPGANVVTSRYIRYVPFEAVRQRYPYAPQVRWTPPGIWALAGVPREW